jgi:hypothetical protein
MRFMAPHGRAAGAWRGLVLRMAARSGWFRSRVDSGRLAEPATYVGAASGPAEAGLPRHGTVAPDVRLPDGTRLRERLGRGWVRLVAEPTSVSSDVPTVAIGAGTIYASDRSWLIRPDGYIDSSRPV